MAPPQSGYHPKGCLECRNTGYYGREGIYEILLMSEPVQELVSEHTGLEQIRRQAMKEGMHTLRLSGAQKVAAGATTIEEVMRVAPAAQNRA
jgi:general secretion pathway protein E